MQVTAEVYYKAQIQKVQQELDAERKKLKRQNRLNPKARKQLHKRICQLYEQLRDLKYRASLGGLLRSAKKY